MFVLLYIKNFVYCLCANGIMNFDESVMWKLTSRCSILLDIVRSYFVGI